MPLGLSNGPCFTLHLSFSSLRRHYEIPEQTPTRQNARFKLFTCGSLSTRECLSACAYKTASFRLTSFTEILKFLEVLNKKAREVSDEGALTQSAYRSSGGRLACGIELWSVSVKLRSQGFICSLPQRSSIVPFEIHLGFCLNLVVTFAGCLLIVSTFIPVFFVLHSQSWYLSF